MRPRQESPKSANVLVMSKRRETSCRRLWLKLRPTLFLRRPWPHLAACKPVEDPGLSARVTCWWCRRAFQKDKQQLAHVRLQNSARRISISICRASAMRKKPYERSVPRSSHVRNGGRSHRRRAYTYEPTAFHRLREKR
jgi:hypothetical protein